MTTYKYIYILIAVCILSFTGCKDKRDDHYDVSQPDSNILQQIQNTPELSTFYSMLVKTGYDQLLSSSQSFTVWAPNNEALASLNAAIVADTAQLKPIIANHICYLTYMFNLDTTVRVKMLTGKYITVYKQGLTVEGAGLVLPYDRACKNGVLHVVNAVIVPKSNIYSAINNYASYQQVALINSYNRTVFDVSNSVRIGVNKVGKNIYDTAWTTVNQYFTNIADLRNESALQTFILLSDDAYNEGFALVKPYAAYTVGSKDFTDSVAAYSMISDLTFKGKFDRNSLPDTLTSITGVKVHIDSKDILNTIETSNGMVIVMKAYPVKIVDKVKTIVIEGENSLGRKLSGNDTTAWNHFGQRYYSSASGGYDFVYNPTNTKQTYIQYPVNKLYSVKYKFYWVAANINGLTTTTATPTGTNPKDPYPKQTLTVNNYNSSTTIATLSTVQLTATYTQVSLGEYTFSNYVNLASIRVLSDATYFPNPIIVDYIKMVPVIQ